MTHNTQYNAKRLGLAWATVPELRRRRREAVAAAAERRRRRQEEAAEAAAAAAEGDAAPLDASNIGAQMLQSMGWNRARGLGKAEDGIRAPVTVCALCSLFSLHHLR